MNNKSLNWMKYMLYLFGLLTVALPAQAASFDCAKAGTKVEHMICDNPEISKLDDELSQSYKAALQDRSKAESVRQAQKQWMKARNKCANTGCVKHAYETRLSSLNQNASAATDIAVSQNGVSSASQPNAGMSSTSAEDKTCLAPRIDWRNYEWTLIRGSGQPICEEMLSYLKSRPADVAPPTCPEERLPSNGNWTRPESRILSEAEKQNILRDIPERYRQKPHGPVSYERKIKNSNVLRVIRGDITGDGIPESFLAIGGDSGLKNCERSKRCAVKNKYFPNAFENEIQLTSDAYELLPMNDDGTRVNWSSRAIYPNQLTGGVLIFYKGKPYWLSGDFWMQAMQDDFAHSSMRPSDPYSAIFRLSRISSYSAADRNNRHPNFKEVTSISIDNDPESNRVCRFGYFSRENIKRNPPNKRK